jgi:hypothetical protein
MIGLRVNLWNGYAVHVVAWKDDTASPFVALQGGAVDNRVPEFACHARSGDERDLSRRDVPVVQVVAQPDPACTMSNTAAADDRNAARSVAARFGAMVAAAVSSIALRSVSSLDSSLHKASSLSRPSLSVTPISPSSL